MDSRDRAALTRALQAIYAEIGRAADAAVARFAPGGRLPTRAGGTGTSQGAEPPLGNPDAPGKFLTSTVDGARSWAFAGLTAEEIQDMLATFLTVGPGLALSYDDAGNQLRISLGAPVAYLTDSDGAYLTDADGAYLVEYE
jgi:hypothetical protein